MTKYIQFKHKWDLTPLQVSYAGEDVHLRMQGYKSILEKSGRTRYILLIANMPIE